MKYLVHRGYGNSLSKIVANFPTFGVTKKQVEFATFNAQTKELGVNLESFQGYFHRVAVVEAAEHFTEDDWQLLDGFHDVIFASAENNPVILEAQPRWITNDGVGQLVHEQPYTLKVLGGFNLMSGVEKVELQPSHKQLLWYLCFNEVVTRDELFEVFWSHLKDLQSQTNTFHVTKNQMAIRMGSEMWLSDDIDLIDYRNGAYSLNWDLFVFADILALYAAADARDSEAVCQLFRLPLAGEDESLKMVRKIREDLYTHIFDPAFAEVWYDLEEDQDKLVLASMAFEASGFQREDLARYLISVLEPSEGEKVYSQLLETLGGKTKFLSPETKKLVRDRLSVKVK